LKSPAQRRECEVAFLQIHAGFTEAYEKIGAGVGIENGLKGGLALMHFQSRRGVAAAISGRAQKVADNRDVGVQDLRRGPASAAQNRGALRGSLGCLGCGRLRSLHCRGHRGRLALENLDLHFESLNPILHGFHSRQDLGGILRRRVKRKHDGRGEYEGEPFHSFQPFITIALWLNAQKPA
jgi:hypothetical protein